jgi:hypothetical protein
MGTIDIAGLRTSDPHSSVGHDRAPSAATQSADAAVPHSLPGGGLTNAKRPLGSLAEWPLRRTAGVIRFRSPF